jgi:glutamate---cysteine ligase / carboxylate-amine ligase
VSSGDQGRLHLFEGFGIELEYMIVDRRKLDVAPVCDELMRAAAGKIVSDFEDGEIGWSNELALHVVELKTVEPAQRLEGLTEKFTDSLRRIDRLLEPLGAKLLPTAMHPWMDPQAELRLWPHDNDAIYQAFNRIFDCRGHGWANLQSMHLNLPFAEDSSRHGEFARLHAAIRVVLPILPALAASSPIFEDRISGLLDTRLDVYRRNARRVPIVSGRVIPEDVGTREEYEREILEPIYRDMQPHDPEGLLRHEWCNARGAIARFDRSAIEIRVLDVQETPRADLAIAALVTTVLESLVSERHAPLARQRAADMDMLVNQLQNCMARGEEAGIDDPAYLALFGVRGGTWTAGSLWRRLEDELFEGERRAAFGGALGTLLERGPLARRILRALKGDFSRDSLRNVYSKLSDCLLEDRLFEG